MRFRFRKKKLELLYTEGKDAHKYAAGIVDSFYEVMAVIDAARDIRDLYALKSLHFEKLSGGREGERSLRLNKQWRLTVALVQDDQGTFLEIVDIEDYH